jgi:hypothetical protein
MTSMARAALTKLLSLPIWERLEVIERLISSVKEESTPPTTEASSPPDLSPYFGALKGVFGDGLAYQKRVRDEWE